jgi:hypothetical protein
MNNFALSLALLIAACAVIMLQALDLPQTYVFIGGLVVVAIASWLIDKAK